MSPRLAVLASGRGSNFAAILKAIENGTLDARVELLISDRRRARALDIAREHGIRAETVTYDKEDPKAFETRAADLIEASGAALIVLAGFMRILSSDFVARFEERILNIHPSLLPSFKGLRAQKQALEAGVKIAGCTVHLVTPEMDSGPILGQAAVPVMDRDTEESLSFRILEQEHVLYPKVIQAYADRHPRLVSGASTPGEEAAP